MERKKKHSIIWLIIIVVAIAAIILITIAGARNSDNTAYAAEVEAAEETYDDGIIDIQNWNSIQQTDREIYFGNNATATQARGIIQFEKLQNNKEYTIKYSLIGNASTEHNGSNKVYIFISPTTGAASNAIKIIKKIENGNITEIEQTFTTESVQPEYLVTEFYSTTTPNPANTYWINILKLQISDSAGNNIVDYQSYLYDYLKTQFDNANSNGYENGMNDGESLYRNNPFNGAALISATVIKDKYNITDAPLNLLSNGISFNSLRLAAADHMDGKEEFEGEQGWTVKISVIPFIFEQNQIYISQSYGFASLIMTDINNKTYNISWGDTLTKFGYAITGSTAYGKTIKQIQITFANLDYVGTLYVGQTAAQDSAYNEGYNKGYSQGHIDGYNQATTDSNGPAWAINKLVSTVSAALSTDIIGEISIGDILSVMLGILLTFAVIRFFGGG